MKENMRVLRAKSWGYFQSYLFWNTAQQKTREKKWRHNPFPKQFWSHRGGEKVCEVVLFFMCQTIFNNRPPRTLCHILVEPEAAAITASTFGLMWLDWEFRCEMLATIFSLTETPFVKWELVNIWNRKTMKNYFTKILKFFHVPFPDVRPNSNSWLIVKLIIIPNIGIPVVRVKKIFHQPIS